MAGISGASASSSAVPGTNVPPVSFPGIASGIDYNSIIQKLTNLTLLPVQQYNTQITQINAKNSELIKINGLLSSVQNALTALSAPSVFSAFTGVSSDPTTVTATQGGNGAASPGSYTITQTQLATASSIQSAATAGHKLSDALTNDTINAANNGKAGDTVPLVESFAAITPSNGGSQRGQLTIDGVSISYDVNSDSLQTIVSHIQASVAAVDAGFQISYNAASDTVTLQSTDGHPISLGSPSDRGNLLSVLKLDTAQVNNALASPAVTSAGAIGGINEATTFTGLNDAGLVTPLTGGDGSFFTINGVKITINPSTDNLAAVLSRINSSAAGVTAAYDTTANRITLTSKSTGPQGIVLGTAASGDSSNFLSAVGIAGAGATATVGTQAKVAILTPSGITTTYYSNGNTFSAAIPGLNLNIFKNSTTATTITVNADTSTAVTAIGTFVSAYNAAINEINNATAAPVVQQQNATNGTTATTASSSQLTNGGALYGDFNIESIKDQLINLAESVVNNGNASYQSLSSIGLQLDSSHQVLQASQTGQQSSTTTTVSGPLAISQASGTSGAFLPLDVTKFAAAFAANPTAVASIFNGRGGIVQSFGTYLTTVTGLPTSTQAGLLGTIPSTSFIQNDENDNSAQVKSLQDYVKQITDEANAQADNLRRQFTSTETLIAQYQSVQSQIGQLNQGLG